MNMASYFWFTVHLFFTLVAYFVPFMFNWQLVVLGYGIVIAQFMVFKKCLMNEGHALDEDENQTFYSHLLEGMGLTVNRKFIKTIVRGYLYIFLSLITLWWQVWLGNDPWFDLLFFLD